MSDTTGSALATEDLILARAAADPAFRARLLADGTAAFGELGIPVPHGMSVKVLEDTPTLVHLVLPLAHAEIPGAQLDQVTGGADTSARTWVDRIRMMEARFLHHGAR